MGRRMANNSLSILFLSLSLVAVLLNVCVATNEQQSISTPKAYVIHYWDKHISNRLPISLYLLSKASPLTASQAVHFKKLAIHKSLSSHLPSFCSSAYLFCPIFENFNYGTSQEEKDSNLQGSKAAENNPIKKPQAGNPGTGNNDGGMGFQNYDAGFSNYKINDGNNGTSFKNYSDETNFGLLFFKDYSKEGGSAAPSFSNYDGAPNSPPSSFSAYDSGAPAEDSMNKTSRTHNVNSLTKKSVEPGRFFRESELNEGNVVPMPDIRDKMPRRSFLPRSITSKLPFSTSRVNELKQIFNVSDNSPMNLVILNSLDECERAPNRAETKKCVASIEDMIDFATSILGHNIVVRNTKNLNGTMQNVMIGSVKGVHGGKLTKAVSCHQSFFPYLLYYCHSVPKVKIYEAEILDENTKQKINHGVAICHIDTSAWSAQHGAFVALGSGPGKIEVCHWIFQNDMIWTLAK